jgi:hypothetical protein
MIRTNEFQHKVLKPATRMTFLAASFFAASFLTACDDDDNGFTSVKGKWVGDKTELSVKVQGVPTPLDETDDSFSGEVEFTENGTAIYKEDGEVLTGTWSQNNDKLTLTIPDDTEEVDMSGTYTIKEISGSKLKLYIEKEATIENPDTGIDVNASIKATLYFNKDN